MKRYEERIGEKDEVISYSFGYNQSVVHSTLYIGPQPQPRVT